MNNIISTKLEIKNFKNLNFEDDKNKKQSILLNTNIEEGEEKIGNLLFVVGLNNVGKSNVLEALKYAQYPNIENSKPNFTEMKTTYETNVKIYNVFSSSKKQQPYTFDNIKLNIDDIINIQSHGAKTKATCAVLKNKANIKLSQNDYVYLKITIKSLDYKFNYSNSYNGYKGPTEESTKKINPNGKITQLYCYKGDDNYWPWYIDITSTKGMEIEEFVEKDENTFEIYCYILKDNYNIQFNDIVDYQKLNLNNKSFLYSLKNENENKESSIDKLFEITNNDFKDVLSKLKQSSSAFRRRLEERLVKDFNNLSSEFNKIIKTTENTEYKFKIIIEEGLIEFAFYQNDSPLDFEKQSDGFKWFFELFIWLKLNTNNEMKPKFVLIDETFGNNITPQSRKLLVSKLREFAYKTGIIFIVTTHDPFLIDTNYLEELRFVIQNEYDGLISSTVLSKFHDIDQNHINALNPLLNSFAVSSNVFLDKDKSPIYFVEGITDYCYLTAMAEKLEYDNIKFLPFQGVKKSSNNIKHLFNITKTPNFLVDGDSAGNEFKNDLKEKFENIVQFKDVPKLKSIVEIEDMFNGFEKYDMKNNKTFEFATAFKKQILADKIEINDKTIENFKNLFDYLLGE
ncbi:AAA family ATPase [Mycoplasma sp. OR1901]|uniref:AAA family ATPase n=1 Tax=Mycoplasma sp. OR1901 TaxID=2742195 RepID=UPI001582954F|nr:AAA family ATPase [Mycoplasma sp. OR1901]QKT05146.1 ATP-binding protein [Mycoplasma sp. OR1901]